MQVNLPIRFAGSDNTVNYDNEWYVPTAHAWRLYYTHSPDFWLDLVEPLASFVDSGYESVVSYSEYEEGYTVHDYDVSHEPVHQSVRSIATDTMGWNRV